MNNKLNKDWKLRFGTSNLMFTSNFLKLSINNKLSRQINFVPLRENKKKFKPKI